MVCLDSCDISLLPKSASRALPPHNSGASRVPGWPSWGQARTTRVLKPLWLRRSTRQIRLVPRWSGAQFVQGVATVGESTMLARVSLGLALFATPIISHAAVINGNFETGNLTGWSSLG